MLNITTAINCKKLDQVYTAIRTSLTYKMKIHHRVASCLRCNKYFIKNTYKKIANMTQAKHLMVNIGSCLQVLCLSTPQNIEPHHQSCNAIDVNLIFKSVKNYEYHIACFW